MMVKAREVVADRPVARTGNGNGNGATVGGEWRRERGEPNPPIASVKLLALLVCASSVMLFTAFTGAYIVLRHGFDQWPPVGLPKPPRELWINTAVIVASSLTLGWAQWAMHRNAGANARRGTLATLLLGLLFVALQVVIWNRFTAAGVRASTGSYGSIFYALTFIHALHVLVGVVALGYATVCLWRHEFWHNAVAQLDACALYWHFVGAMWLYLYVILCVI